MVRVISEKFFSPPRSRHSSGETVDKELAARAVEALSSFNSRRFELSDYESSSDSHWDSEVDLDGDGNETGGPSTHGEECSGGETDAVQKRRERRRERNKLSAQAYRIRRREKDVKKQNVLRELEEKNSQLKDRVQSLENQIHHLRRSAVVHPPPPPPPTTTTTPLPTAGGVFPPPCLQPPERVGVRGCRPVDNDASRCRLLSPLVDNFSFSQPASSSPAVTSPALSPQAASPRFSFPVPSSPRAVHPHPHPHTRPNTPFVPPTPARGQVPQAGPQHSPGPQCRLQLLPPPPPLPPPLPSPSAARRMDLNANSEEEEGGGGNLNTRSLGYWQRSDTVNNNSEDGAVTTATTTTSSAALGGGARPKTRTGGGGGVACWPPEVFKFPQV